MTYVLGFLIIALVVKDTVPLGDSYVLRGLSEGLALAVGLSWFLKKGDGEILKKYSPVFLYLGFLVLTSVITRRPLWVFLQGLSLASVVLFFIAFIETHATDVDKNKITLKITAFALTIVCLISVILAYRLPQWAYESTLEGPRFRGLFGKSGMMAATAGILLGLSIFGRRNWPARILGALAAFFCLYLTGSRSFWIAAAVGIFVTASFYFKNKRAWILASILVAFLSPLVMIATDFSVSSEDKERILRMDSLTNLSGRVALWNAAFKMFWDRPILGHGFTLGADAFGGEVVDKLAKMSGTSARYGKSFTPTFHNGFVQALLDSGAIGALLYTAVIGYALWAHLKYEKARQYGVELYSLMFLTIGNLGETIIFTAADYYAVFYWYVAIFAMSLKRPEKLAGRIDHTQVEKSAGYRPREPVRPSTAPAPIIFSPRSSGKRGV